MRGARRQARGEEVPIDVQMLAGLQARLVEPFEHLIAKRPPLGSEQAPAIQQRGGVGRIVHGADVARATAPRAGQPAHAPHASLQRSHRHEIAAVSLPRQEPGIPSGRRDLRTPIDEQTSQVAVVVEAQKRQAAQVLSTPHVENRTVVEGNVERTHETSWFDPQEVESRWSCLASQSGEARRGVSAAEHDHLATDRRGSFVFVLRQHDHLL